MTYHQRVCPIRRDPSPQSPTEYPRRGRGVAATHCPQVLLHERRPSALDRPRVVSIERGRSASIEMLHPPPNDKARSASVIACVFAMLSTIVGGGALSLPFALKALGAGPGLLALLLAALASDVSLLALCSASRRTGLVALPELARHCGGAGLEAACVACLLGLLCFCAVAYLRLLRDMVEVALGFDPGAVDGVLAAALGGVLLPLSLFDDVSRLAFAAAVSFAAAVLVAATFWVRAPAALGDHSWTELLEAKPEARSYFDALGAVPIVSILFLCQFNVLSVHAKLNDPTRDRLKMLVHTAVGLATVLYVVLGVGGLAVCKDVPLNVAQDALACLAAADSDDAGVDPLLAGSAGAFGLAVLLNTPAIIIPLRDALVALPFVPKEAGGDGGAAWAGRVALTAFLIAGAFVGAVKAPGVAAVWAVAGSSVGLFISYTLPCGLYLFVRRHKSWGHLLPCALIVLVSALLLAACLSRNVFIALMPGGQ